MGLGKRLWTLWRTWPLIVVATVLSLLVSVSSVADISLSPPSLTSRTLDMATGTTHVVVDTPRSSVLDLRQNTYDFEALTQRAVLLGNVMSNGPVREGIARRANVPVETLQITAPLTPKQPRAVAGSANQKKAGDILKSTDQYRLSIEANPNVPVLDIYSQAPTARSAEVLANASVDSLKEYLSDLAASQRIPAKEQVQIRQLGRAHGTVITEGMDLQVAFLTFVLTFAFACATAVFLSRVRQGFRLAALAERRPRTDTESSWKS